MKHAEAGKTKEALCGARPETFTQDLAEVSCVRCLRSLQRNACVVLGEVRSRLREMRRQKAKVA